MFCQNCGSKILENATFCPNCGSKVEKPQEGTVMAMGNGKVLDDGKIRKPDLKVGDRILFSKYSGRFFARMGSLVSF